MSNSLKLQVLGGLKSGPIDAFEYYGGESRKLILRIIDEEDEGGVSVYNGDVKSGTIISMADASGGFTTITSMAHGLSDGVKINITDTDSYDGNFSISNVTLNTFDIEKDFNIDEASGTWHVGPVNMNLLIPGSPNDVVKSITIDGFDEEDRSIFTVNLSSDDTKNMISGFLKFDFEDAGGNHRTAYSAHVQSKLVTP